MFSQSHKWLVVANQTVRDLSKNFRSGSRESWDSTAFRDVKKSDKVILMQVPGSRGRLEQRGLFGTGEVIDIGKPRYTRVGSSKCKITIRYLHRLRPFVALNPQTMRHVRRIFDSIGHNKLRVLLSGEPGETHTFVPISPRDLRLLNEAVGVLNSHRNREAVVLTAQTEGDFEGFTKECFDSCETGTSSIRKAQACLELLRLAIEPEVQQFNGKLHGIVSRPKKQGTNEYEDWAWLMFTNAPLSKSGPWKGMPLHASDLTQLTVNISRSHLYVGLCVRKRKDAKALRAKLENERNSRLFDSIVASLGSQQWIITVEVQDFDEEEPRYYDARELRVALLDPKLYWINARLDRDNVLGKKSKITKEIVAVFRLLYNIYALALDLEPSVKLETKAKPWKMPRERDEEGADIESDDELLKDAAEKLAELGGPRSRHVQQAPRIPT